MIEWKATIKKRAHRIKQNTFVSYNSDWWLLEKFFALKKPEADQNASIQMGF